MGVERFVFSPHAANVTVYGALQRAVAQGGDERAIDQAFMTISSLELPCRALAYGEFARLVRVNLEHARAQFQQQQAEARQRAAEQAEAEPPAEPDPPRPDEVKAIPGHVGIYTRSRADGTVSYLAKWPDSTKASGTATKGGFDTADEAEAFRNEQTRAKVAA
jgi:hypothetical protein